MAESVLKLKKQAVELGADREWAVTAGRSELEDFIANKAKAKSPAKKSATKASKKKTAAKTEKPKAEKSKKTAKKSSTKAPAEKSKKKSGEAKRPSTKTEKSKTTKAKKAPAKIKADKDAGRVLIGKIDWSVEHENWKPRADSAVMRLFKALKKTKGDIDKSFDLLKDDVWDFVGKKKRNGDKRTKAEAYEMLRYRLNRTKFEFSTRTGQHAKGANRIEYGSGPNATTKAKKAPAKPKAEKAKASTKKTTAKKAGKKKAKK